MMLIKNGLVFTADFQFAQLDVLVEEGTIKAVGPGLSAAGDAVDAEGAYVLPGFVDIHSHGCMGYDLCDGDAVGLGKMLAYYGGQGILSVVPATVTSSEATLRAALEVARPFFGREGHGAVLRGVNLEGPFVSKEKKGAQNLEFIIDPQLDMFGRLQEASGGNIRLVDLAPELPGSMEFIRSLAGKVTLSLAHTTAGYDAAAAAFDAGASHVTHLFNAMLPFGHREPGLVGAASDKAASVEIISDGHHLHPSVVRAVFRWFGAERVCLVSDSMRATGMADGDYSLGGQQVHVGDGKATLADGTLAGSITNLADCCRRAIGFGVPMEQAIRAASANPAAAVGLSGSVGSIEAGKRADIHLWDKALRTKLVLCGEKILQ